MNVEPQEVGRPLASRRIDCRDRLLEPMRRTVGQVDRVAMIEPAERWRPAFGRIEARRVRATGIERKRGGELD